MSDILNRLDMVLQMMVDGNSYPCTLCDGTGTCTRPITGTRVQCDCTNGTVMAKATDATVAAAMLGSAITGMQGHFEKGDFGTVGLMLKWCVGYAQAMQADALRELAARGVSAQEALSLVVDRSREGNERRAAEQPKEPNIGALTPEEIDEMTAPDEIRNSTADESKPYEEDCEDMGFLHDPTGKHGACRNCPKGDSYPTGNTTDG